MAAVNTRVAVIAETFADQSPRSWAIPPGPTRRFRRIANVGATAIHTNFIPMWISLGGSYKMRLKTLVHQLRKWVPWSAEVGQP